MRIIAAAGRDMFIVEMSQSEIIKAAGFNSYYDEAWVTANGGHREAKVGTVIKVDAAYDFHHRVRQNQKEAGSAANTLRALADLIGGTMPDVVIPPPEEGIFDNEEWIVWSGQERPYLNEETFVEIEKRTGHTNVDRVKNIRWNHSGFSSADFHSDVIRYRVKGGAA